jgi:transcriptional regulator with XRE-family HTH domain
VDTADAQSMAVDAHGIKSLSLRLKQLGLSQAEFAAICDVTAKTVNNWVKGRTRVHPTALIMLEMLEHSAEVREMMCIGVKFTGAPRGKPFAKGNPYRLGDRRRTVSLAGVRMARAARKAFLLLKQFKVS